jgi:hypothetical protein
MRRIRQHLTFANVVSVVALFVALGGTAAAAVIITDNSQVAQNTISGHKPPSGKHANVIAGSINGQDVFENSLGGRVIAEPTLTGNARRLIFNSLAHEPAKIATVGPYTIKGTCTNDTPSHWVLTLYANGPAGTANYTLIDTVNDNGLAGGGVLSNTASIPANQDAEIVGVSADTSYQSPPDGNFQRYAGTVMLRSGSGLVQLDLNAVVDATSPSTFAHPCSLYGTGTNAT